MRLVFFGTPPFAVPSLAALADARHDIAAVVTQPERPRGRGLGRREPSAVAAAAARLGLPVLAPARPSEPGFLARVEALAPEAFAVAAYGRLLPDPLLALAPSGAWNVHPSLLPRWRGPAPVHRAIWAGDPETGVCIMRLVARLDAGPIARREAVPIAPRETRGRLEAGLAALGARLLVETLQDVAAGRARLEAQDDSAATVAPVFEPGERVLAWERGAADLDRLVRALLPQPCAHFLYHGVRVKVTDAVPVSDAAPRAAGGEPASRPIPPGTLAGRAGENAWRVACGAGALDILAVQPEGKRPMSMAAFVAGRRLRPGDRLGGPTRDTGPA